MVRRLAWVALVSFGGWGLLASCGQDVSVFNQTPTGTVPTGGGGSTTVTGGGGQGASNGGAGGHGASNGGSGGQGASSGGSGGDGASSGGSGGQGGGCPAGSAECDGNPGTVCETDIASSSEHCGGCNQPCATQCVLGHCTGGCNEPTAIDEDDPVAVLAAIGLCTGVQSASWVRADGSPPPADITGLANFHLGHGVLPGFGPNVHPQQGTRLLALSSGTARRPADAGYQSPQGFDKTYTSVAPPGFPKTSPACPGVTPGQPHDATGIQATLSVPAQAGGFAFDLKVYSFEWPAYVCSQYADQFLALLSPPPPNQPDGNVVFDAQGNTMGAHSSFIDVCACQNGPPCTAGGLSFACTLGAAELQGTGFEEHAATGWLESTVPVVASSTIMLRLVTYDSGDGVLDSTTLIDDFRWTASAGATPVTVVVPDPL